MMDGSQPAVKPNGRPFQKGADPRRNMRGNLNKEAQLYEVAFRNALAKKLPPSDFAKIVVEGVRRNRPGAREFYADRLLGKMTQPIQTDQNVVYRVVYDKGKKDADANG